MAESTVLVRFVRPFEADAKPPTDSMVYCNQILSSNRGRIENELNIGTFSSRTRSPRGRPSRPCWLNRIRLRPELTSQVCTLTRFTNDLTILHHLVPPEHRQHRPTGEFPVGEGAGIG